jgi:uncharacterized phage protein (TIGR01671 family)
MREIKFRAWDKTKNVMLDRVLAGCNQDNMSYICNLVWIEDKKDWLHFDKGCGYIMQYTGLKDKNGKEIYEGDIARGRYNNWIISFESGCFQGKQSNCVSHLVPICNMASEMIEVIGNIYENPELLGVDE